MRFYMKRPTRVDAILAVLLYGMNVADCFLTLYVISIAGSSMELNPLMRLMFSFGTEWFMILKLGGGLFMTLALLLYPIPRNFSMGLAACTFIYFLFTFYHTWGLVHG
jgi:hypothetical protein